MNDCFLIVLQGNDASVDCEGVGSSGRRYAIRPCGNHFSASLIAGEGQPITAVGCSQLEALRRAEWIQTELAPSP
jgi:hypothetical protein